MKLKRKRRSLTPGGAAPWSKAAIARSSSKVCPASGVTATALPASAWSRAAQWQGPPPMVTPVNNNGCLRSVARLIRSAMMTVGEGMTSLKQFSIVLPLSKSNISCVPVPTSTARMRIGDGMGVLLKIIREEPRLGGKPKSSLSLFQRRSQFQLNAVRVAETEDRDPEGWKISHFSVLYAVLVEKGCRFVEFSAVSDAKAEVI